MKPRHLCLLALSGVLTSSCIYYTNPVPEMPYTPHKTKTTFTQQQQASAYNAAAQAGNTWFTAPPATATTPAAVAPFPAPVQNTPAARTADIPAPTTQPAPAPAPAAKAPTAITQPTLNLAPAPAPKPAVQAPKPADAAKPAVASSNRATARSLKEITNDGPIPVATPVPGKPTHVYNPLEPDLTIRITDKNGNIYPSGKLLKVRGTNFYFYVP